MVKIKEHIESFRVGSNVIIVNEYGDHVGHTGDIGIVTKIDIVNDLIYAKLISGKDAGKEFGRYSERVALYNNGWDA